MSRLRRRFVRITDRFAGRGHALAIQYRPASIEVTDSGESNPARCVGAEGYQVLHPDEDPRRDYRSIYDVSGDSTVLDKLVMRLAPGGEIVLAGFYSEPLQFAFAPAFMREAQIRCAAEWHRNDLMAVTQLATAGAFSLDGLITHHEVAENADSAYRTAFGDAACLKMVLDWRHCA
jgi:3-hydroxyethyl bacteriochlorophyllide a dehydrogenase